MKYIPVFMGMVRRGREQIGAYLLSFISSIFKGSRWTTRQLFIVVYWHNYCNKDFMKHAHPGRKI